MGDTTPADPGCCPMSRRTLLLILALLACSAAAFAQSCPPGASWCSGTYAYDAMGNIRAIGADTYVYDTAGRLVSGTADVQRTGILSRQDYAYDAFGNRTAASRIAGSVDCPGACELSPAIDATTNHLAISTGAQYDDAGNLKLIPGTPNASYTYDAAGSLVQAIAGSDNRQFIYTADDERIATANGASWTWTVRGLDGKVLREFTSLQPQGGLPTSSWQWSKDYVWRDGLLLASVTATPPSASTTTTQHFHLDHLSTPRLVTGNNGVQLSVHSYYPFGAELNLTPTEQPPELMKFTGHERDLLANDPHTLDYMHARYEMGTMGRFLSIDPVLGDPARPRTWNRYAYVHNNPVILTDPDGRCEAICWGLIILGGVLLSGDVANAPAPGDKLYPSPGVAGAFTGASASVGFAYSSGAFGNVTTITRYMTDGEANAARDKGEIPNVGADGKARPTHATTDKPVNDADIAEKLVQMKPNDVLDVQLIDAQEQVLRMGDVSISIDFFLHGHYRYGFRLGPTDADGHLRVTYRDVEERRLLNLKAQSWDYKTRLDECDPIVRLSVPRQDELDAAVRIATSFNMGTVPAHAEQWARANNRHLSCTDVEVELVGGEAIVGIHCERQA
jgi:RHS repeat-associated protein